MPENQQMPAWVIPAVQAATSLTNSMLSGRANRKTIKANKEMAKYAYAKDLEMWERTNTYNAPEAQMARLQAAGLNPNMVYGQTQAVGNTSSPAPRFNPPDQTRTYRPVETAPALSSYYDTQLRKAQIDNVNAATKNTLQRTINDNLKSIILGADGKFKSATLGDRQDKVFWERANENMKHSLMMGQTDLQSLEMQNRRQDLEIKSLIEKGKGIQNLSAEEKLRYQRMINKMLERGVTTQDNVILRVLLQNLKQ